MPGSEEPSGARTCSTAMRLRPYRVSSSVLPAQILGKIRYIQFIQESGTLPLKQSHPRAFPTWAIVENELNVWHSVPSIVENMRRLRAGEMDLLRTLEVVILCGELCRRPWVEYLLEYCAPNVRIYNAYGPTETTVFCVTEEMNREYTFDMRESNAPLGIPREGAQLYL